MVTLGDARLRLGAFELEAADLHVRRGEYLVLLGPSGAGKSVLLEVIAGLRLLDSGQVLLDGADVTSLPPERRRVGLVSQKPSLYPHLSVRQNIAFGGRYQRVPGDEFARRVAEMARLLRVEHLLERGVRGLSGGEAQRVTLARALVTEPSVLLLDEPLGPLDRSMRADLIDELRRIHDRLQRTTVHVTHDQAEARLLADRVAVMVEGKILQIGTLDEVCHNPASASVGRLVGTDV
jgi:ABC-type sugar transport system ATPase subunit